MSPALRRQTYRKRQEKKTRRETPFISLIIFVIVLTGLSIFILRNGIWGETEKFSLVIAKDDGEIIVSSFDKKSEKITNVYIPGSTQVSVSRQLGTWKLKSVWKLGENEKIGGDLVRETIIKNFHFPVYAFAPEAGAGFANGNLKDLIRAVLVPYKSNITFSDKLKIALFSLNVKPVRRVNLALEDSSYLNPTKFVDGTEGYIISTLAPSELLAVFSDTSFVSGNIRLQIKDYSETPRLAENVGRSLEFLGGKIASLLREEARNIDCEVSAKDKRVQKLISLLLNCSSSADILQGNFDVEIKIGEGFAQRY